MKETELKKLIFERLRAAGLLVYLSEGEQQCLDLDDGLFVEIVVKDASKLPAVRDVIESIGAELQRRGVPLDFVVRALWGVKEVEQIGEVRGESGAIKSAYRFRATLQSAERETIVEVDVSLEAERQVKARLGRIDAGTLKKLVRDFLVVQLSTGGTSYWDPVRDRHLEMGDVAAMYVLEHSPMNVG